jgi:LmbE family N-acetylglucosaminyl deacetylase
VETTPDYLPQRVMSIHAHPDDQEFTVAGSLARWARAGAFIVSVIITSGDAGSNAADKGPEYKPELAALRQEEQCRANELLGIQETVFLGYPDGELVHTLALRKDLTRLIRRYKPDTVVCGDPTIRYYGRDYLNHPDHRAAADAALDAAFPSAGTRLIFADLLAEGLEPHQVKRIYIHGNEKPDTWIDISETIDLKIQALRQHASQVGGWQELDQGMRDWAAETGKDKGLPYAEAFRVMVVGE